MADIQPIIKKAIFNAQSDMLKGMRKQIQRKQADVHASVGDLSGAEPFLEAYDVGIDTALELINNYIEAALTLAAKE